MVLSTNLGYSSLLNISTTAITTTTNSSSGGGKDINFENLVPAIVQCFIVVVSGYVAGRTGRVSSSQARGIARFVSTFCLPAMLFRAMCTLDFSVVNWNFLAAILIAKASVFVVVAFVTLLIKRPLNLGLAGLFGIFATQSNDFALGYPLIQALYKDTHPEYVSYIYLISPISLLILNPIGFILLEIHRHLNPVSAAELHESVGSVQRRRQNSTRSTGSVKLDNGEAEGSRRGEEREKKWYSAVWQVVKGVLFNPIVYMTVIGLAGNLIFHQNPPALLDNALALLAEAFAGSALFYLGLSMVDKVKTQIGLPLVVPMLLICAKSLLLPLIIWVVVSWLQSDDANRIALSMYGFLYGTFPAAPAVVLFAVQYSLGQQMVTTSLVLGTILSAPLMFGSAKMMTVVVSSDMDYHQLLLDTSFDVSIVSIIGCVYVLVIFVVSGRWRRIPHRFTCYLVLSQMLACIGMVVYQVVGDTQDWAHYVQFIILLIGVFSSRCWTAALAVGLCLLHARSLCSVLRAQAFLIFFGFGFPSVMTGLIFLVGAKHISDEIDPSFHYGFIQTLFSAIVLSVSLLITLVSMVIWQRNMRHQGAESRYAAVPPTSRVAAEGGSVGRLEGERMNAEVEADGLSSPPRKKLGNYQTCGPAQPTCSTSIEDIIPFPNNSDSPSEGSGEEDHGMIGSRVVPVDERTCLLNQCSTEQRLACRQRLRRYAASQDIAVDSPEDEENTDPEEALREEYQSTHHLLLLLLLSVSMFVGLFLCLWKLFTDQVNGIYVEIEFLDSLFNYGQALLVVLVFGFDTRMVFSPIMRRIRRWWYGADLVHLPETWEQDEETQTTCHQFISFHLTSCRSQICRDGRQLVFGTDTGSVYLSAMSMEGAASQLESGVTSLSGLVFSDKGSMVQWSDDEADGLWSMPLSTRVVQRRLHNSGSHPRALWAWGSTLYFLTASGRTIHALSSTGAETTVVHLPEFGHLTSLHFFGPQPPEESTGCSERNGRCSTLCIPMPNSGRQCQCADGASLLPDKRTCDDVETCTSEVRNGQLSTLCDRYPRETCTYTCNEDYAANPSHPYIRCGSTSGLWNVSTDSLCLRACPRHVSHGQMSGDCPLVAGWSCQVVCDAGFVVTKDAAGVVECGQDGAWLVSSDGMCQETEEEEDALPIYAIAIISAGGVAVVAVIVGCVLYRRMKKYKGRNSSNAPGLGLGLEHLRGQHHGASQPPAIFVTPDLGGGATGGKCAEEEEYAELEAVEDKVRYSPLPVKKPGDRFNGGLQNRGFDCNDGNPYVEPDPDYDHTPRPLPIPAPPPYRPAQNLELPGRDGDYLTPSHVAPQKEPAENGDYLQPYQYLSPPVPHAFHPPPSSDPAPPDYMQVIPPSPKPEHEAGVLPLRKMSRSDWTA